MDITRNNPSKSYPLTVRPGRLVVWAVLMGVFTIRWPVVFILALGISLLLGVLVLSRSLRIDWLGIVLMINFAYWIGSGLLVGAVGPLDLLSPDFFQGDGRVFSKEGNPSLRKHLHRCHPEVPPEAASKDAAEMTTAARTFAS